jgi:hypothetical protein
MAIGLLFFPAIGLSEYRIGEFEKISENRISDLGLNLSDIGLRKKYRLPTSDVYAKLHLFRLSPHVNYLFIDSW